MSQSSKQKIFRQQMAAMLQNKIDANIQPCPVCGANIKIDLATINGFGETIPFRSVYGNKLIPRFSETFYPCGCKLVYDRLENKAVRTSKREASE